MASLIDVANHEPQQERKPEPVGVPTAQRVRMIQSIKTDLLIQSFNGRILVVLTQLGKIGCLIQIHPPPSTLPAPLPLPSRMATSDTPSLPPAHPSVTLSPLFGVPPSPHIQALHDLYATHIGSILFDKMTRDTHGMQVKPVILGIGLKRSQGAEEVETDQESRITDDERETFMQVMDMVKECIQ
ncbi:uncharacterized protein JCM15063_002904 [Sporobolomyces koalae]|uniref:uncharacterized protein n=1 Tax=Sporobolomyces koalae TaxID=500713 RepID=UPI00317C0C76